MITAKAIQKRAREVFGDVGFREEGHRYSLKGEDMDLPSVSSVYKRFIKDKDWDAIAARKAEREGISKGDLLDSWALKAQLACDRGKDVHLFAERYAAGEVREKEKKEICRQKDVAGLQKASVMNFFDGLLRRYEPVLLELKMYHPEYKIFGMSDVALFDNKEKAIIPLDHKSNEDIFKHFGLELLQPPFHFLEDTPFNHYQIQLSLYQILIEQMGFPVSDRILVWHKHDGSTKTYHTYDFTSLVRSKLAA
jgi:hypothetical protein